LQHERPQPLTGDPAAGQRGRHPVAMGQEGMDQHWDMRNWRQNVNSSTTGGFATGLDAGCILQCIMCMQIEHPVVSDHLSHSPSTHCLVVILLCVWDRGCESETPQRLTFRYGYGEEGSTSTPSPAAPAAADDGEGAAVSHRLSPAARPDPDEPSSPPAVAAEAEGGSSRSWSHPLRSCSAT
jgi:hypothetical protein